MKEGHPDLCLRVARVELLGVKAHVLQAHRVDYGNPHHAPEQFALLGDLGLYLFELLDQLLARIEELPALRSDHERTLRPINQRRTELHLQLTNGLARRRLRDMMRRGTQRKATRPDHFTIERQGLKVHKRPTA